MDFKVLITEPAIDDLSEIVGYISRDNPTAAQETGMRLIARAESLARLPLLGRIVPEREQKDCREVFLRPYRIIYRVKETAKLVEILRFWHSARGTPVVPES